MLWSYCPNLQQVAHQKSGGFHCVAVGGHGKVFWSKKGERLNPHSQHLHSGIAFFYLESLDFILCISIQMEISTIIFNGQTVGGDIDVDLKSSSVSTDQPGH